MQSSHSLPSISKQKLPLLLTIAASIFLIGAPGASYAAKVVVNSTANDILKTVCTFRGAAQVISDARTDPNNNGCVAVGLFGDNDTITFDNSLAGQRVVLPTPVYIRNAIVLEGPQLAIGNPAQRVTLAGTKAAPILEITDNLKYWSSTPVNPPLFHATIRNINFVDGGPRTYGWGNLGGAIYYSATPAGSSLLIEHCDFVDNLAEAVFAGGVPKNGSATIRKANFINNTGANNTVNLGGQNLVANIEEVAFSGNVSTGAALGYQAYGTLNVTNSTFSNNRGDSTAGSAIRAYGGVNALAVNTINVSRSTFINNQAIGWGNVGSGAAIYASLMRLNVVDSVFEGNTAYSSYTDGRGGAIYLLTSSSGMMINPGDVNILRSTFSNNSVSNKYGSAYGGAIFVQDGNNTGTSANLNISQSTFSGNTADGSGGAVAANGSTKVNGYNLTFVNNAAPKGASVYVYSPSLSSPINAYLYNTLVTGNSSSVHCFNTVSGKVGGGAYNLVWRNGAADTSCGGVIANTGDPTATLGALADNGGLTKTHALLLGNPAIASGSVAYLKEIDLSTGSAQWVDSNTDQRGYLRPAGAPDIGAYAIYGVAQ